MKSEIKATYPSGNLKYVIPYIDGMKNGRGIYYYENGQIQSTVDYCDNQIDGYVRSYALDGSLESQLTYTKGECNGDLKTFNNHQDIIDHYDYDSEYHHHL